MDDELEGGGSQAGQKVERRLPRTLSVLRTALSVFEFGMEYDNFQLIQV
jgi:hypothetical protein